MKTLISTLFFLFVSVSAHLQTTLMESEKIATFTKFWGFLKYYHPVVAKGKLDWDMEFMTRIKVLPSLKSKQEISEYYLTWIKCLGEVKPCKKCKNNVPDSLKFNLDLAWLSDSSTFSNDLISKLQFIQNNRNVGKNYYVQSGSVGNTSYENEKSYKDSVFPSVELRLLGLSRYWNIINYFFPYKYLMSQNWNNVLVKMVPIFKDSKDTIEYHLAMLQLTAKIDDSHAGFVSKYTNKYFGIKWAPFRFKIIDNKAIVNGFYNDSLAAKNDILFGDVFLKVGNVTIEEIIKEKSKYIGASNEATKLRNFYYAIFNGDTDSVRVTFERNGAVLEKVVYRYFFKDFKYDWSSNNKDVVKILDGNIGYINMGLLQQKQTDSCLNLVKETKAIIFDVRNYPKGTLYSIANFLNSDSKPFVKFTGANLKYPGVYYYSRPIFCGKKNNKNAYKGKVILLFNESSQSHAEFTLMALQTASNVTSIGSQTAGADGNVSIITFPGNYQTYMTGIGIYYPDGRETQRIGIVPDIEIKPTIAGIKQMRDEVLEKAIEIINK
jgi:carboxyl-terminal processing protease